MDTLATELKDTENLNVLACIITKCTRALITEKSKKLQTAKTTLQYKFYFRVQYIYFLDMRTLRYYH